MNAQKANNNVSLHIILLMHIFKNEQLIEAKNFARKYAAESEHGAIVEIIIYRNNKAEKRVYTVRRK